MPSRGFQVRSASASPPGMASVTTTSPAPPCSATTSATAARIISRGTGLMAGSPGGSGRPGLVTVPTPSPARNVTPEPAGPASTRATTSAPCVTSGSSPASLTMPASAQPAPAASRASAKAGISPRGKVMVMGSGKRPVTRAVSAALVAAVAQAPVVQP